MPLGSILGAASSLLGTTTQVAMSPLGMLSGGQATGGGAMVPAQTTVVGQTQQAQQQAGLGGAVGGLVNLPLNLAQQGLALGGSLAGGVLGTVQNTIDAVVGSGGQAPQGPVGRPRLYTQVIAVYPNGWVELREERRGKPKLYSRDVQTAKRVARTASKVYRQLPRRTVRQSKQAQLTEGVLDKALRSVNNDSNDICCK